MANQPYSDRVCRDCNHWHDGKLDPNDLRNHVGQCRLQPALLAISDRGKVGFSLTYPAIPADFPACSHFSDELPEEEKKPCLIR